MKKLLFMFVLLLIVSGCKKNNTNRIVYSWNMKNINDNNLIKIVKKLNVNTLYQDFSTDYLNGNDNDFLKKMEDNNIRVYHLSGDPSWGIKDSDRIIKEINKVINYNKNNEYKISGIVLDIESYILSDFDKEKYLKIIMEVYGFAKNNNIYLVLCIPTWYKEEYLDKLIRNVDEISIMNYNINNTISSIDDEVMIAKKYGKKVNTIYEINFNDNNYFSSFEEINHDYEKIITNYNYPISIAFHHYDGIRDYSD